MRIVKKKIQKYLSLLLVTAIMLLLPLNSLTVSAAEPVTYVLNYVDGEWRFQVGSEWNSSASHRELYYMHEAIKDGDLIVIDGGENSLNLNLSVRLSNLTVKSANVAVVYATGYDACYILGGSVAAINGDVANVYVYGSARCTFNNNVTNMEITNNVADTAASPVVTCGGTVGHLILHDPYTDYHFYNIAQGKLVAEKANISTDAAYYTTAPSTPAAAGTTGTGSATTTTTTSSDASLNEYDDVPKTGESNMVLLLCGLAIVCFLGCYALKRDSSF